jgi:hypothetical protein
MTTIISQNTTWKKGDIVNLTSEVQVASGVTLTIQAGVTINGNGNTIRTFGNVVAEGTSTEHITTNNVNFAFGDFYAQAGKLQLNYLDINGGSFLANSGFGSYTVTNSNFSKVSGFYIWYPTQPSSFIGNTFYKSSGLSIGTNESGTILIKNNTFLEQTTPYAIESWANYNSGIQVINNSFLSTDRVALSVREKYEFSKINAIDNYFGTTDALIINAMIFDQLDSLNCASIISTSHLEKPAVGTPAFDTTPPSVAITSNTKTLTFKQTATLTFTLTEPSTNFTISDIAVTGGTLSNFSGTSGTYTATFTLSANFSGDGTVSIASGVFSDAAGNVNTDVLDADNKLTVTRTVTVLNEKHSLSVIVDTGVLNSSAMLLKGLNESITYTDGVATKHTVEYSGITFDYSQIDSLITAVTRDDEFTMEFRKELTDFAPTSVNLSYKDAVLLIGLAHVDNTLIAIAGADGNYVG